MIFDNLRRKMGDVPSYHYPQQWHIVNIAYQ
jgi:hypothetical protein